MDLEPRILDIGRQLFAAAQQETPSLFNKSRWTGKVMDWCLGHDQFKVQMFRFVDVFPTLTTSDALTRHIEEYFGGNEQDVPDVLRWGAKTAGFGGAIGAKLLSATIRSQIEDMARQFIVGDNTAAAVKNLARLKKDGFDYVVDVLGEATITEKEADHFVQTYLDLIRALHAAGMEINISIKPSALYSQAKPQDFDGSVDGILARLRPVYAAVIECGGVLCIDMESLKFKNITLELFRRLRADPEFRQHDRLGIVLQAYLCDTDRDLDDLLAWARRERLPLSIRLVKGAYWDYETVLAEQNDWPCPVWQHKPESDIAFERLATKILQNHDLCQFACASHNFRSIAAVMATAQSLNVPAGRFEFQVLYGMAEPVRRALLQVAGKVRLYCPYGELVPGMAYLVRRLLENTANESFLRQGFAEGAAIERLLAAPQAPVTNPQSPVTGFRNEPAVDFTRAEVRAAFPKAIAAARRAPLPTISQATREDAGQAIAKAQQSFPAWRDLPVKQRAGFLRNAAAIARRRIYELAAHQILEVGKQWDQAYADVTEAIDFFEFYAGEMERLAVPRRVGSVPGELNQTLYEPRGVAVVIAPWNFPLAISAGMCAAALVAGNTVVFKPSDKAVVTGHTLLEIFREVGLPAGVFNFLPGRGSVIGDFLVEHPDVALIAFTGSVEVGLRIIEKAAKVTAGQMHVKGVIAEMGGKNAIIVDDDADLDETVPGVLYSAFGFQGQKCSACSRVIVLDAVYDRFVARLVEAAGSLKIGPVEDPANFMGPVVDAAQQQAVNEYVALAKREGRLLYSSPVPANGCYVPLTIVGDILPEQRIAQEEVFGPVLAVLRAKDFEQALAWANATRFALTGGVYSRSPRNLDRARREFRVGNLYLNRHCTGALVERQPFGGFKLSGVGTKAGGVDYLLHFLHPRTISENTMRRGFAPADE